MFLYTLKIISKCNKNKSSLNVSVVISFVMLTQDSILGEDGTSVGEKSVGYNFLD